MNKELKNLSKDLKELNKKLAEIATEKLSKDLEEALKEEVIISFKKGKNDKAETTIEGSTLAILIGLAGLEKTILEHLKVPKEFYDLIKTAIGTKEVK